MSLWQCFFLGYSLSCYPIWAQPCSAVLKYFLIEIGKRKVVPLVEWKFIHLIWGTKCDRLHRFATFNATYYWGRFNGIGRSPSGDTDGHIHFRNFCCLWQKPTWIYSFLLWLDLNIQNVVKYISYWSYLISVKFPMLLCFLFLKHDAVHF